MPTLDQMIVFLAVVKHGSFSAAARRIGRAQPSVTHVIQTMETELGLTLFDRSGYRPVLTQIGHHLLPRIEQVVGDVDTIAAQARAVADGVEAEVSLVVDAIYPMPRLANVLTAFNQAFPGVAVRLSVQALGGAIEMILNGAAVIGIVAYVPDDCAALVTRHPIEPIPLATVASPAHPLVQAGHALTVDDLRDHLQLVLSDPSERSEGRQFGVLAARIWRIADLGAKHAMLLAGLGWGGMPRHMVERDIAEDRLCDLPLAPDAAGRHSPAMRAELITALRYVPGPATGWLHDRLLAAT